MISVQPKKAMILAAGKGERMRPLTLTTPKPLLRVQGKPLIVHHIERLAAAGIQSLVINVSYLGNQIIDFLGDGEQWGVSIKYSQEAEPLETAGGVRQALPLLGEEPFLLVNGDVWCDMDFSLCRLPQASVAHLVLVNNPAYRNDQGDFDLEETQPVARISASSGPYTFAGISILTAELMQQMPEENRLGKILQTVYRTAPITGEVFTGHWVDVGTPERLQQLELSLAE